MAAALRVYLDEDVDVLLARLLSSRGFDCLTASELGHLGWTDQQHLEWAAAEERIMITHNRVDFEVWHASGGVRPATMLESF